jgi:hypothetical protein
MSPLRTIRRAADRVVRTVRYGWGASLDVSRSSTDVLYPEYDAYDLKPRRLGPIMALTMFVVAGVFGVYLALAHGLGSLILGAFTSKTDPGRGPIPAAQTSGPPSPAPSPSGPRIGQPVPAPAPTVTVTNVVPGAHTTSTATVTATPTHTRKHGNPTPTGTPPTPSPTGPEGSSPPATSSSPEPTGSPEGP